MPSSIPNLPPCDAVLFDLDGTLLDTLADLAAAANAVLAARGYPVHPVDAYRLMVGEGVHTMVRRALPSGHRSGEDVAAGVEAMQAAYGRAWAEKTRPYPGILPLLEALEERGIPMAVLSNKPEPFTRRIAAHFFGMRRFRAVLGESAGRPRKPAPDGAFEAARRLGCPPEKVWLLGDSRIDMQTAVTAGMVPLGAAWGFRGVEELRAAGAALILEKPRALERLLAPRGP